ncbi:Lrp/AsnC family transcriptional regulator [Hoeflea sp.]|uniref:Lrp/AsnC family transcriptional regulator n=1 Tax=Hoeflea sp. TaxID=1940281 RepID=UPI003B014378
MGKLDDIDDRILRELRRDSRIPVSKLADKVGRSRTAVRGRIDRMEASGQILAYSIREPSTRATEGLGAIVFVTFEVRRECKVFLSEVKAMPEIAMGTWIIGEHDFALILKPLRKADLQPLLDKLAAIAGVKHTETVLALDREF